MEPELIAILNAEQLTAVKLPAVPALMIGGPGSGKTRVINTRIAWLLNTGQVSPEAVMAVTFNNKAAKDMLDRLAGMLPLNVRDMWIGTFHGLSNRFLRAHWNLASLQQSFQILDQSETILAVKHVIQVMNLDEERFPPKQVSRFIAGCKEDGRRPDKIDIRDANTQKLVDIYRAYEDHCVRTGVVDFGELLLRTVEIMRDKPEIRDHYRRRFRHILIDAIQDISYVQYAWLKMFAPPPGEVSTDSSWYGAQGLFAAGDGDQSIYAFRGAQIGNIRDFLRDYGVQEVITLEKNYRSTGHILNASNKLIAHGQTRLSKPMQIHAEQGELIRVYEATSDHAEAQWITEELQELHRRGTARREMAIFYRSHAQSRVIESALLNAGIPYRKYGALRFFQRSEIKQALAYLRLIACPDDDLSLLRVLNVPPRGIDPGTLRRILHASRESKQSLGQTVRLISGDAGVKLLAFIELVDRLRVAANSMSLEELVEFTLIESGLIDYYRAQEDSVDRIENLQELVNAAAAFVKDLTPCAASGVPNNGNLVAVKKYVSPNRVSSDCTLNLFLEHAFEEDHFGVEFLEEDAVLLSTVHQARGLEFDAVFISGLEEGLFPHANAITRVDGLKEERCLMYMGITRARKWLSLSCSQVRLLHGQTHYNLRSRWFDELPEASMKWLMPRSASFTSQGYGGSLRKSISFTNTNGTSLRVGQHVFHDKFGKGEVLTLEGLGLDARAQVKFIRHGIKWLALSVAKLTCME